MLTEQLKHLPPERVASFVDSLSEDEAIALSDLWELWALPHQQWPEGEWKTWMCRAGRGSGKSYMGAKWCHEVARDAPEGSEIGIIAQTHTTVRKVCIEGQSGILHTAPHDFRPKWEPGKKLLTWPNGIRGHVMSADRPDSIRGSQFIFVWCDEMAFWPNPEDTWKYALIPAIRSTRLQNASTKILITTTPIPSKFLKNLESQSSTVVTRSSTYQNRWLDEKTKREYEELYKEDPLAEKQELYGEYVEDNPNALFTISNITHNRISWNRYDELCKEDKITKIIIAIDPAGSVNKTSDETGIIVASMDDEGFFYILDDLSGKFKPEVWAEKTCSAFEDQDANLIVAEKNYGGDMVESVIKAIDQYVPIKLVNALKSKRLRAEPVSALYKKNLVRHVGIYKKLEEEMTEWVPGNPSPNRLDALVYAILNMQEEKASHNRYDTKMSFGKNRYNRRSF
jgi:phage terminase large subunit-like protein